MDSLIPPRWRLEQYYYDPEQPPKTYPVFIKPEWGQNSNGIVRADNENEYIGFQGVSKTQDMPYIVQDAAPGEKEFEIYYLRSSDNHDNYDFLSVTAVTNTCLKSHPINSIHNPCTCYVDITKTLSTKELLTIWSLLRNIGEFRVARFGLKADNIKEILNKKFHIIEINIFLPMPLVLLAENVDSCEKKKIIKLTMLLAAKLVKNIPKNETGENIFFKKTKAHYKIKL